MTRLSIAFVRAHERHDRIFITFSDGQQGGWRFPSYGEALPHDLVHFGVETAFELSRGVWGLVASGIDFQAINAQANHRGGTIREKYAGLGDDLSELLFAEALATARWFDQDISLSELREDIVGQCQRTDIDPVVELTDARLQSARELLFQHYEAWSQLAPKQALNLTWPATDINGLR